MKKVVLVISLFVVTLGFAQQGTIKGVVLDGEFNKEPLAFASVSILGTDLTVNTDINGNYSLEIDPGTYTLIFDFIGYNSTSAINLTVRDKEIVIKDEILQAKKLELNNYLASKG